MSKRGWLLFAAMSLIWGIPYLLIKVADEQLTPPTIVFLRTGIAAVLLVPIAARRDLLRPLLKKWQWMVVYTIVEIAGPWLLLTHAETRLSSSLSGLLIAAVPLIGAIILVALGSDGRHDDRLGAKRLLGLLIGLGGVGVLVGCSDRTGGQCDAGGGRERERARPARDGCVHDDLLEVGLWVDVVRPDGLHRVSM